MNKSEVKLKSLLNECQALTLLQKFLTVGTGCNLWERQLNHDFYADIRHLDRLAESPILQKVKIDLGTLQLTEPPSVRSEQINDGRATLIIKASLAGSSENGSSRLDLEAPTSMGIEELDAALEECGIEVRCKWSRIRHIFYFVDGGISVFLDKNAGYGWILEADKIAHESEIDATKSELAQFLAKHNCHQLESDRLDRMRQFYERNWQTFYKTDNHFVIY